MRGLLIFTLLIALSGKAEGAFFNNRTETGWFHYNWKVEEENKTSGNETNETEKFLVVLHPEKLDNMTAEQIQKLEKELRGIAVMKPTLENVYLYNRLVQYINRKADEFVKVNREVSHLFPDISKTPTSTIARRVYLKTLRRDIESAVREMSERAALVVFVKEGCPYCRAQERVLSLFKKKYPDFYVKYIDVEEHPAMVEKFNVAETPTIWLVYETDNGRHIWQVVSVGVASLDRLENSIYEIKNFLEEKKNGEGYTKRP